MSEKKQTTGSALRNVGWTLAMLGAAIVAAKVWRNRQRPLEKEEG